MHGLFNKSLQSYLRDTFGGETWLQIARDARLDPDGFESMLIYDDAVTRDLLDAAAARLGRGGATILEDLGTYLVSHHESGAFRRLLRFSGVSFIDFLHSSEQLPEWGRLAVPDLDLPRLSLEQTGAEEFRLNCRFRMPGAIHVIAGILRAMADEYGALVVLRRVEERPDAEVIDLHVPAIAFSAGRRFALAR